MSTNGMIAYNYGQLNDGGDQMISAGGKLGGQIAELRDLVTKLLTLYRSQLSADQFNRLTTQINEVLNMNAQTVGRRGVETQNCGANMRATDQGCAGLFDMPIRA